MNLKKRKKNENVFSNWVEQDDGGRIYSFEVKGRLKWKARYIKEVDKNEKTLKFYQEIYNEKNELVEIHEKYPQDNGHQKIKRNGDHKR